MTSLRSRARRAHDALALGPLLALAALGCAGSDVAPPSPALLENEALQEVVTLQTARDARGIARLLEGRDPVVRARAAFALGSVQDQAAAFALIERLEDESPSVRAEAAFALGQLPQGSGDIEEKELKEDGLIPE